MQGCVHAGTSACCIGYLSNDHRKAHNTTCRKVCMQETIYAESCACRIPCVLESVHIPEIVYICVCRKLCMQETVHAKGSAYMKISIRLMGAYCDQPILAGHSMLIPLLF